MKKIAILIVLVMLALSMVMSAPAIAADIIGHIFTTGDCTVSFAESPFGPGENGTVTVACGTEAIVLKFMYSEPVLFIYSDTSPETYNFVLVESSLYYLDPSGLVLTE